MYREREVVMALRAKATENLVRHKVTLVQGLGSFEDAHTIRARSERGPDRLLRSRIILIATGSRPFRAAEIPFDDRLILDSDTILQMDRLPRRLAVVGAGVGGCEYAAMVAGPGVGLALL